MSRIVRIDPRAGEPEDEVVDARLFELAPGHVISLTHHHSRWGPGWNSLSCSCGEFYEESLDRWAPHPPAKPRKPIEDAELYQDQPEMLKRAMKRWVKQMRSWRIYSKRYEELMAEDPHGYSAAVERHRRVLKGEKGIYSCGCTVEEGAGRFGRWAIDLADVDRKAGVKRSCPRHQGSPYIPKSKAKKPTMKASEVLDKLAFGYKPPEWVFVRELRVGTGYSSYEYNVEAGELVDHGWEQRLDAFALNCWPSKGFLRIAFEVKVSRSDFLSEIKNPQKREAALRHSNQFYFVCPEGLVQATEIPPDCGLIEIKPTGGRKTTVAAPVRECAEEMPVRFVASLLRHAATKGS